MTQYFHGQQEITKFGEQSHRGKRRMNCLVYEQWIPVLKETVRCGASTSTKLLKRIGVRQAEKLEFDTNLSSSLGAKAVAQISSEIKSKLAIDNIWEIASETERSVTFTAPECGRYDVLQFQLVRYTEVITTVKKLFREQSTKTKVCEYLNEFHDESRSIKNDPDCGCEKPDNDEEIDGFFSAQTGNISVKVPFRYVQKGILVSFPNNKIELQQSGTVGAELEFEREWLSEHSSFFLDNKIENNAVLTPYTEVNEFRKSQLLENTKSPVTTVGPVAIISLVARMIRTIRIFFKKMD